MKHILVIMSLVMGMPSIGYAQTITTAKIIAASGALKIQALPTSGGTQILFIDPTTLDVVRRAITRSDLASAVAYEDEFNTFSLLQTFGPTTTNGSAVFTSAVTVSRAQPVVLFTDTASNIDHKKTAMGGFQDVFFVQHLNDAETVVLGRPLISTAFGPLVLDPGSKQILPNAPYEGFIGSPLRKWLGIWAAELNIDVLTYSETLATSGGRWLVAPSTMLIEDISDSATVIKVKHNNLANGDIIYSENNSRVEYMTVTSSATRLNKAGIGNLSAENGTTNWAATGSATITSSVEQHWHGGKSLKWSYISGGAGVTFSPASMLANSTVYTVSIFIKRADGQPVVPIAGSAYRLFVDVTNTVLCNSTAQDMGNAWYRLSCSGTTGGAGAAGVGVSNIPSGPVYLDAVQVELGTTLTAWNRDSSSYTVTRNLDGTGADVWEAGTGIVNTRSTGFGLIDCYATQGFSNASAIGPTCAGMVRTSSTYNAMSPRWAIGNLNGLYGYATDIYGAGFGDPAAANLAIDATNGIRFRNSTTTTLSITGSTIDLTNTGVIKSGSATAFGTGTGIWLAANSGTPQFRVGNPSGNRVSWDGTNVAVKAANFEVDGSSVRVNARNSALYAAANGYNFTPITVAGAEFGMFGFDTGTSLARGLNLRNVHSSSGAAATFEIAVGNSGATDQSLSIIGSGVGVGLFDLEGFNQVVINGTNATSVTLACGAGQAVKNLTVILGLVTAASCGAP